MKRRGSVRRRLLLRVAGKLSACALGLTLLLEVSQAGQSFLYCLTMQQVMSKSCCAHAREAEPTRQAVWTARNSDCCELRVTEALAPYSPSPRAELPHVPYVALPIAPLLLTAARDLPVTWLPDVSTRAGPPPGQVRAQLMVFLI